MTEKLPWQELALDLCELAGVDPKLVYHITIDCPVGDFPTATFDLRVIGSFGQRVEETVRKFSLRPIGQEGP
jgi:hypothetical protein